jgi:hypothetical protein
MPKVPEPEIGSAAVDLLRFNEKWNVEPAANGSLRILRRPGRSRGMQPPRFQLRRLPSLKARLSLQQSGLASMYSSAPAPFEAPGFLDLVLKLTATVSSLLSSER